MAFQAGEAAGKLAVPLAPLVAAWFGAELIAEASRFEAGREAANGLGEAILFDGCINQVHPS